MTLKEEVHSIINFLSEERGINLAGAEAALGLPQRYLSLLRDGKQEVQPEDIALLRVLKKYPWMIEAANDLLH